MSRIKTNNLLISTKHCDVTVVQIGRGHCRMAAGQIGRRLNPVSARMVRALLIEQIVLRIIRDIMVLIKTRLLFYALHNMYIETVQFSDAFQWVCAAFL